MDEQKLVRFFAGLSSEQEQQEVRTWIDANPSFRRVIDAGPDIAWEADRAATVLADKIRQEKRPRERHPESPPDHRPAARRFARRVQPASSPLFRYAAVATLVVVAIVAIQWISGADALPSSPTAAQGEVVTARGQRTTLRLPDDTKVVLNAESRLQILDGYAREQREVYLQGKAFFDVTPQTGLPFIIHTDEATVRVLGTSFSVAAYTEQRAVEVAVAEGRVLLHQAQEAPQDSLVLGPRDLGIASLDGLTVQHNVNLDQHHAWTEGRLVFEATPLEEVAYELERWFDVQVRFADPALKDRRLTGQYEDQSLSNILKIISFALDIQVEREEKMVTFSP